MDPKGDRLRLIKAGQLKLPESVLQNTNLSADLPKHGGGCLEGGPRPRPVVVTKAEVKSAVPIIIPVSGKKNSTMIPVVDDIPLPSNADIPLPPPVDMRGIPLPSDDSIPLPLGDPLPDIPLPSNDSIPLPADKPTEQRKMRVTLEPTEDELLCRSCQMKFSQQIDYDQHLTTDAHQQALKADLQEGRSHGTGLPNIKTCDKRSPTHDIKSGPVSFSFKKNIGARITNTQPFHRKDSEKPGDRKSPEIKILRLEPEEMPERTGGPAEQMIGIEKVESGESKGVSGGVGVVVEEGREQKLMTLFVKVHSKDDSARMLDWPKEMIQYTVTEPKLMFSCNPLAFDFSQLSQSKKKSPARAEFRVGGEEIDKIVSNDIIDEKIKLAADDGVKDDKIEGNDGEGEKKKSHKKKKKHKKHKKHKTDDKDGDGEKKDVVAEGNDNPGGGKKKKKKKHKKKSEENTKEGEQTDNADTSLDKEKKKHKKSKKKRKRSDDEAENGQGEEEKKSKKHKKKKSKKRKKKSHHSDSENDKSNMDENGEKKEAKKEESDSGDDSGAEKDKEGKKKKKRKKKAQKKKENGGESSCSESEKVGDTKITDLPDVTGSAVGKKKFPGADSDTDTEQKYVKRLQALNRSKAVVSNPLVGNSVALHKVKKEPVDVHERKTPSDRKRVNSESSVNETTPVANKKSKVLPGHKDNPALLAAHAVAVHRTETFLGEESFSKIETMTQDNVKSKWDTSDSEIETGREEVRQKRQKLVKKQVALLGPVNRPQIKKEMISPKGRVMGVKMETDILKKALPQSASQRSTKSNMSAGSAKRLSISSDVVAAKRKMAASPASSHSSRSRSRSSHSRSYSHSSRSSRSRSYSSSSYYSDRGSRRSGRRRHRSSSRSYSRSSSRSYSRSRRRRRRSSSYSDSSRSRSYSYSRSRSRSHHRRRRSYSRSRSRSYSTSSYDSHYRRSRSRRRNKRKRARKSKSRDRPVSMAETDKTTVVKKEEKVEKEKVDPSDIPLPDLSGKKEEEISSEKLDKLRKMKPRTDVGEQIAEKVKSLPENIPLPASENITKTVSSDALPTGPPTEPSKESDSTFIGPRLPSMAPPPPPPPGHMGHPRYPHGHPGPPRPGYWDQWDGHYWDGPGHWDGPGPRPFRGMRPPFDHRMRGPYDPRMRGPPPFMNRPRGPPPYGMGPRYPGGPGMHGPPHGEYMDYDGHGYGEDPNSSTPATSEAPKKEASPPPLPPPKAPSPKPPPPKKKEIKEPEQNPAIAYPPEQIEKYKHLQEKAAKHARKQQRREQKKALGEPDEDSTSSEEEPEEQMLQAVEEEAEAAMLEEMNTPQLVAVPAGQQMIIPQPASSPRYSIVVSGSQQILIPNQSLVSLQAGVQAGVPLQAGAPVLAVSQQSSILANHVAAAANAQPAHIVPVQSGHHGIVVAQPTAASLIQQQQLQQAAQIQQIQQLQQIQHAQQLQQAAAQAQAIQAHNIAVAQARAAAAHGPIIVGNQVLVPTIGVRPAM